MREFGGNLVRVESRRLFKEDPFNVVDARVNLANKGI